MHVLLHSLPPTLQHATTNPCLCQILMGKSVSFSFGVIAPFSWVLVCIRFCLSPLIIYFPVLCKFCQLSVGINGNLLQEGSCHTQVCPCPCPCCSPLLTCTFSGDIQTQFFLRLYGISVPWCAQGLFQPSERLSQVWGFILLGSYNREKESKMAVDKRQGREKPAKIEQRKVKGRSEDLSEDLR